MRHREAIHINLKVYIYYIIFDLTERIIPRDHALIFTTYSTSTGLHSESRDDEFREETIKPARTHGPTPSERTRGVAGPRGVCRFIDFLDEAAQPRGAHEAIPRTMPDRGRGAVATRHLTLETLTVVR